MKKISLGGKHGLGKFALVDDEDFEKVNKLKWYVTPRNYVIRNLHRKNKTNLYLPIHRFILDLEPKGETNISVDHTNGNPLDNRKCNLRICTDEENIRNRGTSPKTKNKFKGVYWRKNSKKWYANIYCGRSIHLGAFALLNDAVEAYNKAALKYHGEFAHLNVLQ